MNIHFERSGGFTGISVKVTIDTNNLQPEQSRTITEALSAARFFELPEKLRQPEGRADQFVYRLVVDDNTRHHAVEMDDSAVPEPLQPILRQMILLARQQR